MPQTGHRPSVSVRSKASLPQGAGIFAIFHRVHDRITRSLRDAPRKGALADTRIVIDYQDGGLSSFIRNLHA